MGMALGLLLAAALINVLLYMFNVLRRQKNQHLSSIHQ
jgi:hypothetical protein